MVVENVLVHSDASGSGANSIKYIPCRLVMTQEAADQAIAIAEQIVATGEYQEGDDASDERALFIALHTCAYQATHRPPRGPNGQDVRHIWVQRRTLIRDHLVQRNLGLAYSALRRFDTSHVEWDDLRSEALVALVRAVDGFDPWRGCRFSTYACTAITRALIQEATRAHGYHRRIHLGYDGSEEGPKWVNARTELCVDRLQRVLQRNSAHLTDRERHVLARRFAICGGDEQTLSKVGQTLGLSKEGTRQIQNRGLSKIRKVLEADPILH
ncbi:MAG: sigma-70 family RNA polymerase sigma factor [Phycisphaerales bacterium]|nr:MAG: sigma-70 family RNA polymerase sigma factor [Phycisphaerales bacterium]